MKCEKNNKKKKRRDNVKYIYIKITERSIIRIEIYTRPPFLMPSDGYFPFA